VRSNGCSRKEKRAKSAGLVVLLRLSGELPYGRAVEAIDAVKSAGVTKLSLRMER
jgi:biopolymer transport protein ExbD